MSALKPNRPAPTPAQVKRWVREYTAALSYDGEPCDTLPSFKKAHKAVAQLAADLTRLAGALAAPFAPGNAAIMEQADEPFRETLVAFEGADAESPSWVDIEWLGGSLRWGLAGADQAELVRLRAERARAREERDRAAEVSPEQAERHLQVCVELELTALANMANGGALNRPLTVDERWRLVLELQERLGICECGECDKPSAPVVQGG